MEKAAATVVVKVDAMESYILALYSSPWLMVHDDYRIVLSLTPNASCPL